MIMFYSIRYLNAMFENIFWCNVYRTMFPF